MNPQRKLGIFLSNKTRKKLMFRIFESHLQP